MCLCAKKPITKLTQVAIVFAHKK